MARSSFPVTFRLATTQKLWGSVYRLDKKNSFKFLLVMKSFLYQYFIKQHTFLFSFYFYPSITSYILEIFSSRISNIGLNTKDTLYVNFSRVRLKRRLFFFKRRKPYNRRYVAYVRKRINYPYATMYYLRKLRVRWWIRRLKKKNWKKFIKKFKRW
jgi:hypothetical protein